jgi:hypothetical protein
MDNDTEAYFEAVARGLGLHEALRLHRDDVLVAARSAHGYQARREVVAEYAAEPAHVFRIERAEEDS